MSDLANRKYIRWNADGVISIPPGEKDDIEVVVQQINKMQEAQFNKGRHAFGGTHARTQGIVKGTFITEGNLPAHLKQTELFEKAQEFPAAIRYSTEPGDPGLDDRIQKPRGLAMKLFNVKGEMFEAGADFPTHDIEFNSAPALELSDAKTTREIFDLRMKYGGDQKEYYKHLEKRKDTDLQKAPDQLRNTHLESRTYYSQTAYRFGDYVAKYRMVPNTAVQKQLEKEVVKDSDPEDILHKWLSDFHKAHHAEYIFQVQLLENLDDQPVEYAGKPWDEEKYPFQTVAKLVFPMQDSWNMRRKSFWEDHMRVDPFLGLKSFEPIGGPNRLRRALYPASSALRRKLNGREEIHLKSIDDIPD